MSSRAPLQRWDNFTRQIQCSSHQLGFCCRLAKQKPFLTKRHVAAREEFAKRHLDVFLTMQTKLLWSNDRMIKLLAEIPSGVCIGNQALSVPSLIPSPTAKHDGGASYCGDALLQQRLRSTETPESGSPIQPCWKFSKIMVCQPCANLSTLRILMLKAYFNLLFFNLYTHTHAQAFLLCLFKVLQLHLYFLSELNLLRHFYTYCTNMQKS